MYAAPPAPVTNRRPSGLNSTVTGPSSLLLSSSTTWWRAGSRDGRRWHARAIVLTSVPDSRRHLIAANGLQRSRFKKLLGRRNRWTAMRPVVGISYSLCSAWRSQARGARRRDTGNQPRAPRGYQGAEPLGWFHVLVNGCERLGLERGSGTVLLVWRRVLQHVHRCHRAGQRHVYR
jgi:hypothetical protein